MLATDALRLMIEDSGLTHKQLEARAGRYGGWIGQSMARPKPGADLIASIAHACGYRLMLVPTDDDAGRAITIGDEYDDAGTMDEGDAIQQARTLLARAVALLDDAGAGDD